VKRSKTGKHIYSGIVYALVLLVGSYPLSAPLSVSAMDLVVYMDALSPAMQRVVSYLLAGSIMSIGMAAGFCFGFTRSKKADQQEKTRRRHNWELLQGNTK